MTLKDVYTAVGADYDDAVRRLMNEDILLRFVRKFPSDPSFPLLQDSLEKKDVETAFRAAHTLKGICANFGFTGLYETVSQLTELLRSGTMDGSEALFAQLSAQYKDLTSRIAQLS